MEIIRKKRIFAVKIPLFMKYHLLSITLFCVGLQVSAQNFPYQNPELSAKERAKDLCSRLTLEEKAMLMLDESPAIPRLGIKTRSSTYR